MIDLRSDTVTRPTPEMLAAMMQAETGDDVYGEDPTVNRLEAEMAALMGKEAGLYAVSGTQSNFLGLLSHCQRGDEYIAGQTAHTYLYEAGGAAVLGGIQPYTIPFNAKGEIPLDALAAAIKPDDYHFAKTRLVCLENTQAGKVLELDYLKSFSELADKKGLRKHLDGARIFNAAVKLGVEVGEISQYFDTVSICLSKGLACPVGAVLVGDKDTIARARRWRKMIGGGMRQAGVLAAAGLYALTNNVNRLQQDHDNAKKVGDYIDQEHPLLSLAEPVQTNMVMLGTETDLPRLKSFLADRGITISGLRWVFHQDVSSQDVDALIEVLKDYA